MKSTGSRSGAMPAGFFAMLMLPFVVPILLTFALVLLVGDLWPRHIVPGSGLKLAGLGAATITSAIVWRLAMRGIEDRRAQKFAALLSAVTGLMGWPVWSTGILPSINGFMLDSERTVQMSLERIEITPKSKSRGYYHWAWLRIDTNDSAIGSGRYFISEEIYNDWNKRSPATVDVQVSRGVLGAYVVTGFS